MSYPLRAECSLWTSVPSSENQDYFPPSSLDSSVPWLLRWVFWWVQKQRSPSNNQIGKAPHFNPSPLYLTLHEHNTVNRWRCRWDGLYQSCLLGGWWTRTFSTQAHGLDGTLVTTWKHEVKCAKQTDMHTRPCTPHQTETASSIYFSFTHSHC